MMISKFLKPDQPKAVVRDKMLVLSLTNAVDPVVWRLDIRDIVASALEVRKYDKGENNEERQYELVLKTPKATLNTLARFENKEAAITALKAVTSALENAPSSQLYSAAGPEAGRSADSENSQGNNTNKAQAFPDIPQKMSSKGRPVLAGFLGALVIIILLIIISGISTNRTGPQTGTSGVVSEGTPLPANEFLKTR